jgi:4-hydroxy-tetrahydrodipicolinate synthase
MNQLLKKLYGTGVALITPFHKDGSIDFKSYSNLIEHVIKGKCEYIVPLGTTGENSTLSREECKAVLSCAVETVNGRVPVVLGLGGNNTREIIRAFEDFDFDGVDAILSVSPYYSKPAQRGIIQHYKALSVESPVPIILYNVPARTGSNLTAETTLTLAHECKNIIGIKEASGNVEQAMFIIHDKPENFLVISGDDGIALPLISAGAAGVISVIANAYPQNFSEMIRQSLKYNFAKAKSLHYDLMPLLPLLFAEGNPAGIKFALKQLGICEEHMRLPQVPVSKTIANKIAAFISQYNS